MRGIVTCPSPRGVSTSKLGNYRLGPSCSVSNRSKQFISFTGTKRCSRLGLVIAKAASTKTYARPTGQDAFEAVDKLSAYLVSTQEEVQLGSLWQNDEKIVFCFARSMG